MMHPVSMLASRPRAIRLALASLLAATAIACAEDAAMETPPAADALAGPWTPVPMTPRPELVAAAEAACRRNGMAREGDPVVVADARGADVMLIVTAGPARESDCFVLRDGAGRFETDSGGASDGMARQPALAAHEVRVVGSGASGNVGLAESRGYVIGQVGAAVATVQIEVATGERLEASVSALGWFAAWWPGAAEFRRAHGFDAAGTPLGVNP